jgi:hypothetical protein
MTDYCDCRNCRSVRANEKMRAWLLSRETSDLNNDKELADEPIEQPARSA